MTSRTKSELENEIRRLNTGERLGATEARRLQTAVDELSVITGARVTVTGQCISLDVTRSQPATRRPVRSTKRATPTLTRCPIDGTWGVPGTPCRGVPAPAAPARTHTLPELRARAHAITDRALTEDVEYLMRAEYGQVRDAASRCIEKKGANLPPSAQDRLARLIRTRDGDCDGKTVCRYIVITSSDDYCTAFAKSLTELTPAFTPGEASAINSYREMVAPKATIEQRAAGEGGSFGLAIPVMISPEVITGGALDDASIFSVARVVSTTTNVWKGVASTGGPGFQLPGEGQVVGDGSPAFTQPVVNIFTLSDFLPYSIEVGMDFPGFTDEMTSVFKANYLDSVSRDTAQGAGGTSAPQGIVTVQVS